jgi:hypothetical protein
MRKHLITVDSISGGFATLLLRGEEERPFGVVPVGILPEGVKDGDILSVAFSREAELTAEARRRTAELHQRLLKQ